MAATTDEIGDFHGLEPPDLLEAAFLCAKSGREAEAGRIYDYVATLRPKRQMRAYWPLALTCPGAIGEEWATPALKRAAWQPLPPRSPVIRPVRRSPV